jgi:Holliday junction resolvase RusA-like endonuclease
MKLTLSGDTPSQKNRKIISKNFSTGRPFLRTAPAVKEWQERVIVELKQQFKGYIVSGYPIDITVVIYFSNKRRHDLDNALSSIMDAMTAAEIIMDDSVEYVSCISISYGGIDKINPRSEVYIDE